MKTVLITGATGGLGRALAQRYWNAGHKLILMDHPDAALADMAATFADPDRVEVVTCDLAHSASIQAASAALVTRTPQLDILINNAGITHRSPASGTHPDVFRKVMQVDWQGTIELTQAVLPILTPGSTIICIGSMAGWMPVPGRAAYCAAKAALAQFFEVWRLELENAGIRLLMVYPSFLDTPIDRNALGHDGLPAQHPRSTLGTLRSASWMAQAIYDADLKNRHRLFPDRFSWAASLLWRLFPTLYLRQVRRRFADDIAL